MSAKQIENLLLLALPASGKSEVRRYLASLSPEQCRQDFHLGPTVQLDDFPYVHLMRRIDQELGKLGQPGVFFHSQERPFKDAIEWGTLIELVNEDHSDLCERRVARPPSAARHLFDRLERARARVGGVAKLSTLPQATLEALAGRLESEAAEALEKKHAGYPESLEGKTLVIEFARGGPDGATMPLRAPFGYGYSLSVLSDEILSHAAVLYIWVTPAESRRKNDARADPDDPGSILHHGVPLEVMMKDYGCDDIEHLLRSAERPNTIPVFTRNKAYHLPMARFDNRVDKTTFVRDDPAKWPPGAVKALHEGLREAFDSLVKAL